MYRLFLIFFLFLSVSCGTSRSLQKAFVGTAQTGLTEKFGPPKTVLDRDDGKIYIYEIVKELKGAEISQGKLTLDPIVSPPVQKTERYFFTVVGGKVVKAKLEEEYER